MDSETKTLLRATVLPFSVPSSITVSVNGQQFQVSLASFSRDELSELVDRFRAEVMRAAGYGKQRGLDWWGEKES